MRPIDADALFKRITDVMVEVEFEEPNDEFLKKFNNGVRRIVQAAIDDMTTLTLDDFGIVRCENCKYWQDNNEGYPHPECRWGNGETPDPEDYCSFGMKTE